MSEYSPLRLAGKTALVTAAAQGIGRAAALAFALAGAQVWACDRDAAGLNALQHPRIRTFILDVCDAQAVAALSAQVGTLDIVFNCVGMVHHGAALACDDLAWQHALDVNVSSMHRIIRAVLPAMLAHGGGSIINMASVASSIKGFPNRHAYGASKAAVIGLSKALAADYVARGIRCNALCPGTVDTPSLRERIAQSADPVQAEKDFIARQPMGRLATVDDITPLLVYLASDESRFMTGQALCVDGGITI